MKKITERCFAEISNSALKKNIIALSETVPSAKMMAVIKADGYGHGALNMASLLQKAGVSSFCVATISEGVALREAGFTEEKILVMGSFYIANVEHYLQWNLLPTVYEFSHLKALDAAARKYERQIECHLKVDTGMQRYGFSVDELIKKSERIFQFPNLNISGIYSHLSNSPVVDDQFTLQQIADFKKVTDYLELNNIWFGVRHLLNSGGVINYPENGFDAIRPGLSLYGYYPGKLSSRVRLHPAMCFKARIAAIKSVSAGSSIGYSRTFRAREDMTVALLSVGYADGYLTDFSNKGTVLVGRHLCPVVGRVCMDTTIIDISSVRAKVGELVTLWGGAYDGLLLENVAASIGSIPYELTCLVSERVPRVYHA